MKSSSASQLVNFENTICEKCGRRLGFFPEISNMANIEAGIPVGYGHASAALRYAVEDLGAPKAFGAWLEAGDERFNSNEIQRVT
jgi:zinc-ribbon domain